MKRACSSMKRVGGMESTGSPSDIISYLPCNLIEKILTHLPIQDAVRTSVLSRRWRYIWMNLPQLVFDDMFCSESIRARKNILLYMAAAGIPTSLPTTLSHLNILKLSEICFENLDDVSVALCLIRSSPNLEKITIEAFTSVTVTPPILELLHVEDWSDVSLNQLREVTMKQVSGRRSELEFIKLLLAISPMLETILIGPNLKRVADKGLMILKEVIRYRRSSPQAEIIFRDQV